MSPKVTDEYLEARRQQIISAAEVCFARQGIHGATLEDIREQAELSRGAVYHYFKSKEEIIEALRERSVEEDRSAFEELSGSGDPFQDMVDLMRFGIRRNIGERRDIDSRVAVFLWAEALLNDRIMASQQRLIEASRPVAQELLVRAQKNGDINPDLDTDGAMNALLSLMFGLTVIAAWYPDRDLEPTLEAAEALVKGTFHSDSVES